MAKVISYDKSILSELPISLQNDCVKLQEYFIREKKTIVQNRYRLGLLVKKVQDFEYENHLKGLLKKVQQFLEIRDIRTMQRALRLVTIFTKDEVNNLLEVADDGYCIGWGHFEYVLVDYLTKEQMISYLESAKKNHLNCLKLKDRVMQENDREADPQGRRRLKSAKQFYSSIMDYMSKCEDTDSMFKKVPLKDVKSWVKELSQEEVDELTARLNSHLLACRNLLDRMRLA